MRSSNKLAYVAPTHVDAKSADPHRLLRGLFDGAPSRRLEAGEALFGSNGDARSCYLLDEGVLKLHLELPDGRERTLALMPKNSILGSLGFCGVASMLASLVALMACQLRSISKVALDDYARHDPDVYRLLGETLVKHLQDIERNVAAASFLNARGRVAHALLTLAQHLGERIGEEVVIPAMVTQREVAAMAGIARENVNRIVKRWEQESVLVKVLHTYRIRDIATARTRSCAPRVGRTYSEVPPDDQV